MDIRTIGNEGYRVAEEETIIIRKRMSGLCVSGCQREGNYSERAGGEWRTTAAGVVHPPCHT